MISDDLKSSPGHQEANWTTLMNIPDEQDLFIFYATKSVPNLIRGLVRLIVDPDNNQKAEKAQLFTRKAIIRKYLGFAFCTQIFKPNYQASVNCSIFNGQPEYKIFI